jgi:hypothetical protein
LPTARAGLIGRGSQVPWLKAIAKHESEDEADYTDEVYAIVRDV